MCHGRFSTLGYLIFFLLLFISESHASLWGAFFNAGEEAAKFAKKANVVAGRAVLKTLPKSRQGAHALEISGNEVRAIDITGRDIVIATMAADAAVTLTPQGAELLKRMELIVSEIDVDRLKGMIRDAIKTSDKPAFVVNENGTIGRLVVRATPAGETLLMEKYPGIFIRTGESSGELSWALERPFQNDKIRVVSFMDPSDADELARLDKAVGEYHIPAGSNTPSEAVRQIRSQREKTVFVVGHVEKDKFIVRDSAGQIKSEISFSELEDAAEKADASLFFLGCSAAACSTTSAFIDSVNALRVADGLKEATSRATLGDALSALSTAGDLVISSKVVHSARVTLFAEQKALLVDKRLESGYRVMKLTTIGRERAEELANRIIPYIPSWVQYPYFIGAFFLIFSGRRIVREWKSFRAPAPAFARRPIITTLVKGIRILGFSVLMPLAVCLNLAIIYGAWVVGTVPLFMTLGWTTLVPAYFGWKWSRHFAEEAKGEPWPVRYLGIPLFVGVIGFLVAILMSPFDLFRGIEYADLQTRLIYWIASGSISMLISASILRFLTRRKSNWNPSDIPGLVIAAALLLIEFFVSRVLHKGETADE
ncbi:hypothetical protein [Pseudomonas putida]|uniref:hypothetical protein n=1 Tax=Pseudomonas putida TaxID=303 RepID=UPI0021185687|nr:hypothetical protein [Pseudomonas putida]